MFLYKDKQPKRHEHICSFLKKEPVVAVILAASDFEWTVRRAILALASLPTKEVKKIFDSERKSGPSGFKDHWKNLVKPRTGDSLPHILPKWEIVSKEAFKLRNKLVHGVEGRVTSEYAEKMVDILLDASVTVAKYAEDHGETIFGRKIRRIKPRN
jgi:hypothetical protein